MKRIPFLLAMLTMSGLAAAEKPLDALTLDPNMAVRPVNEDGLRFVAPEDAPLRLTGFLWFDADRVYRRMPVKPDVPFSTGVENLAWNTAGGQVSFRSDTTRIVLKVKMRNNRIMYHMASTGSSGFDLYTGEPGKKRFFGIVKFNAGADAYTGQLFKTVRKAMREFTIDFPLYAGVETVFIGIDEQAELAAPSPWADDRPVVVYGTSITQGGCATRPGMAYTNIVSRELNRPVINLGFSGNGKGEAEVAAELAKIRNPAMFVLDYEANSGGAEALRKTLPRFVEVLRAAHPATPILVISKVRYAYESLDRVRGEDRRPDNLVEARDVQKELVELRRKNGDANIHFLDGAGLLGEDWDECSVDGGHQTDFGFYRMAKSIAPVIREILATPTAAQ